MSMIQLLKSRFRFCLPNLQSPTSYNLSRSLQENGWNYTRFNWRANFSEQNLLFDTAAAETLEYKHLLAQLVQQYCSQVMPASYRINDDNWSAVLSELADTYYMHNHQLLDQVDDLVWILKPSLQNNGQNIKIFHRLSQLEQHYISANRLGGEHVLQQYLVRPHLLNGHKYSIRMFTVITNHAGAYIYPYGYFNVSLHPYRSNDFTNLSSHLTNEHLQEDEANVEQRITSNFDFFPLLYQQIKTIEATVIDALQELHPQAFICNRKRTLAIFGFDFMVDTDMRVWLLEANHGPCFPITDEHPLQKILYYDFWQAVIANFVLPVGIKKILRQDKYHLFESVGTY